MKGLNAAKEFHDNNTGMPYLMFKIEDGLKPPANAKIVRVLQGVEELTSLVIHTKFKVLNPIRCKSESLKPDPDICELCKVKAPRTLKTYIPVRVRGNKNKDEVHVIEYGRNNVQQVQSVLEEAGTDGDLTGCDFKIKREGSKKDTKYMWFVVPNSYRPLTDEEKDLEVPDIAVLIPIKSDEEMHKAAIDWQRAQGATKTGGTNDNEDETTDGEQIDDEIPF
jgi:hypothetical protein